MPSKTSRSMTSGSIPAHLARSCVPAILGDLFQVTYSTVDSVIVGRFAGAAALAAVGVASPLMSVAMFFVIGLGVGASVLMSEFFGAGDLRGLRRQLATTLAVGLAFSAAVALGLFALTGPLLALCRAPARLRPDTARYLRVVALGMVASSLYNILAAACRSVGDTLTPLACLVAGALANVALDLWFVAGLGLGVAGAAWATVLSQVASALLCAALLRRGGVFRGDFAVDRALLRRTLRFSTPGALQQAGIYIGKLAVQSAVNPLGVSAIAAFNAVNRIDDYALIPERDIANGETVLVAQNHGAGRPDRMRRGFLAAMAMEAAYGLIVSVAIFALAEPLMGLFVDAGEKEVVRLGARYLRLMGLFYIMPGFTNGLQGYMRALGRMRLTMAVTYAQMLTRATLTFLLIRRLALYAVPLACVAGWLLMLLWEGGLVIAWSRRSGKRE